MRDKIQATARKIINSISRSLKPKLAPVDKNVFIFDERVDEFFYALSMRGWESTELHLKTIHEISTKHHLATIEPAKLPAGHREIFCLPVNRYICVYYTVEPHAVVVRGYNWESTPGNEGDSYFIDW